MRVEFHANSLRFDQAVRRWALVSGKTQQQVLRTSAKMVVSNPRQGSGLMQITPPCSQGRSGLDGKRQGERAIERDLRKHFVPVASRGIGARGMTLTDIAAQHRIMFAYKKPGRPLRRNRAQPFFSDALALARYERAMKGRVGNLASGWVSAARQLGASIPSWIGRHGQRRGTIKINWSAPQYYVQMTLHSPSNAPWQELQRRVPYALRYGTNNLARQIEYRMKTDAAKVGLRVA